MAVVEGAVDGRLLGAPGPWVPRRIEFHVTSTHESAPSMEPLNDPVFRGGSSAAGGGVESATGAVHHHHQQQASNCSSKPGKSEPQSLPSSMPLQWIAPQKIGAGLSNLGNTCFLNSVLQCLTYTPPLAGYLQSGQHKASCRVAGFCAFCALQEHVQQALASSGKVVSPQKLAKNLRSICRSFRMGRQEDSHEYMRHLLDALHKCCLPPDLAKNANSQSSMEKSLVYKIFGGQLRSQVKCTACSRCSNTYDPFLDLSLEIVHSDSLTKALSRFTASDVLDGDNKYRCPHCRKKVRALKRLTIDTVPNILTIQFKRFSSNGGQGGKIDKRVEFGTTLDLKPFVSDAQHFLPKYKLFGVLVHSGWSTHSGHYYCFLRASSDIWHVFDDSRVRQVSERTVLEQKAYMLFYVREVKRASTPHSEMTSTQGVSLPLTAALKERQTNPDTGETQRSAVSQSVKVHSKESESKPVVEVLPKQLFVKPVESQAKKVESNGQAGVIPAPASSEPGSVVKESVQLNDADGVESAVNATLAVNGIDHLDATAVALVPSSGGVEEAAAGTSVPTGECSLLSKGNGEEKEMEIDGCCTTSGNPGVEDNWDEFYKKARNPPGSPPQNLMKLLRAMPHTRRYYQARAASGRRSSKVTNNANGELENGHLELLEAVPAIVNEEGKRPHPNEESRASKRLQMESGVFPTSSSCMAPEEPTETTENMEITSSNGHGPILQENSLHLRQEGPDDLNRLHLDVSPGRKDCDLSVAQPCVATALENGLVKSNGHIDATHGALSKSPDTREIQSSGNELRVDTIVEDNCQSLDVSECEGKGVIWTNRPCAEKGIGMSTGPTVRSAQNDLYGCGVPRWGEVDGDVSLVTNIDRLLESEKGSSIDPDVWDMIYDKGKVKKIRNKTGRETYDADISNLNMGNDTPKLDNPFQAFGMAKQNGRTIKVENGVGIKAGNSYAVKAEKSVGSGSVQNIRCD